MTNINKWSFQRFTRWFKKEQIEDDVFNKKIEIITDEVVNKKNYDLIDVANKSGCTEMEVVYKVMYLKNKLVIGDLYIDTINMKLMECTTEESALLNRYKSYLYTSHSQVEEIAHKLYPNGATPADVDQVWQDLKYLYNKGLLNGILLNDVDRIILYYSLEKHELSKYKETLNCPSCGALVDVPYMSKERCSYCGTIVISNRKEL